MDTRSILGIDPGTNMMGYALVKTAGKDIDPVVMGVINLKKIKDPYEKMGHILDSMNRLIEEYSPDELAIEAPFYGKNVQSMLKLGRAQGIAIAVALSRGLSVCEYAPRKIKMAITGRGSASKQQVAAMLQATLHFTDLPESWDATDALAVAVCHVYAFRAPRQKEAAKSWKEYIDKHPDAVVKP